LKVYRVGSTSQATVAFMAVSNRTYIVQFSDKLGSNPWARLSDVVERSSNHIETVVDPSPTPNRYYRLATPRQP